MNLDNLTKEHKEFIERKRIEIMSELESYLKETKHPMAVIDVLDQVYEESEEESFDDFVFSLVGDNIMGDMDQAQELSMELFNYFPRKSLGDQSLAEKMPFDELQKMEVAFQNYKNGIQGSSYSYSLPDKDNT